MERCLLLAGSRGPERVPARPDPEDADWYLPLHLRDQRGARSRLADQVAAGADIIVAPAWLTHRRALLPLGETRRAGAWTAAAVRLAREAIEPGLERREERLEETPPDDRIVHDRPASQVAAPLPVLDDEAAVATGRLATPEAADARDYHEQAGIIADAEPDLILVEPSPNATPARFAVEAALETGLPVWAALPRLAIADEDVEGWFEWAASAGVSRLLLPPARPPHPVASEARPAWGGYGLAPELIAAWLDAGASVVARLDGATGSALETMRAAIDEHERAALKAARRHQQRWLAHVAAAAAVAPSGLAVWVGPTPEAPLPEGFRWLTVQPAEVKHLPLGRCGLVVSVGPPDPALADVVEHGGLLAGPLPHPGRLRLLRVDDEERDAPLAISRREDEGPAR